MNAGKKRKIQFKVIYRLQRQLSFTPAPVVQRVAAGDVKCRSIDSSTAAEHGDPRTR